MGALDDRDSNAIEALTMLASYRRQGKNLIFAKRPELEKLRNNEYFNPETKKIFEKIFDEMMEFKNIDNYKINKYINVVREITGERVKKINNKEECQLTLEELACSNMSNLTIIITENNKDYEFYKIIGKYYTKYKGIKSSIDINFESILGGGNTTANVLESKINDERYLCLCIVDSDIKYLKKNLTHKKGDTIRKIEKIVKKHIKNNYFWKFIPLTVHEIENLLPICWIENYTQKTSDSEDTINFLKYLIKKEKGAYKAIYYFDLKKGIKKEKLDSDKEYKEYWIKYLYDYNILVDNTSNDHILCGLGDILSRVLEEKVNILFNELNQIDDHLEEKWLTLGEDIFSWGCVGEVMY